MQVNSVEASLIRARQRLADEIAQFRDGLDDLKAALGLPPRALFIPDPEAIAAFREVFEKVHNWHRDPTRTLNGLPQLIAQLPALGEVVVEGRPILGTIEANPDRLEDELAAHDAVGRHESEEPGKGRGRATDTDLPLERRDPPAYPAAGRGTSRLCRGEAALRVGQPIDRSSLGAAGTTPAGGTQGLAQSAGARIATQGLLDQFDQVRGARTAWSACGLHSNRSGWLSTATWASCLTTIGSPSTTTWRHSLGQSTSRRPPNANCRTTRVNSPGVTSESIPILRSPSLERLRGQLDLRANRGRLQCP